MSQMAKNNITSVQVALRIRPLVESEISSGCEKIIESVNNEPQILIKNTDKAFTFNHVFDAHVTQQEVYDKAVKEMVTCLFNGYNVTILAYGQTGSGKTHTMGTNYTAGDDMGVIPRAVEDIYKYIDNTPEKEFEVSVSFMELYQETLYDLLADRPREQCTMDIREDNKGIRVPGLTEEIVRSSIETTQCLLRGSVGRVTGATAMNAQSSRSHAIFTICIKQQKRGEDNTAMSAKFHLVDLAGSERPNKTKATGERFKEGVKINQGLLALGNVISALGEDSQKSHGFICYRDSKLTRLLQDSLGGNSITLMIACVSPADYNLDETISTLRYADRARKIKNKPVVNQDPKDTEITKLHQQIRQLQLQLLERGGPQSVNPMIVERHREEIEMLQTKNRTLTEQLQLAISENTCMFERALITEAAKEKLQQQLEELKQECNLTFQKLDLTTEQASLFKIIQTKIDDVQDHQQLVETEVLNHQIMANQSSDIGENNLYAEGQSNFDMQQQESHTIQQLTYTNELKKLSHALALKEQLAFKMQANSLAAITVDQNAMQENQMKIDALEKEKDELLQQLKSIQNTNVSSKLSEQRRQRVQELETQINDLNRKLKEQTRLIKLKEKDDLKIKTLNNEIFSMRQAKVKLVKMMRAETDKFRQWKVAREREMCKLKDQDRKRQNQIIRMENMHAKQQTVLKRKVEQAAAINKRLKDALALQKSAQDRRGQAHGKAERIQQWVDQDLEVLVSTVEAERTLEHLIEERKLIVSQKDALSKEDAADTAQLQELEADINLRSTQIADLKQKIIDSDQENKAKTRWDMVQSMAEAKIALKYIFELTADNKRKDFQHQEEITELKEKLSNTEQKLADYIKKHEEEIAEIEQNHGEKISILFDKMNGGGDYGCPDNLQQIKLELNDYKTKHLELSQRAENTEKNDENLDVSKQRRNTIFNTKIELDKKPIPVKTRQTFQYIIEDVDEDLMDSSTEMVDDNVQDPDWRKTPVGKRLQALRRQRVTEDPAEHPGAIKRTSDGTTRCSCKGICGTKQCGCRKLGSKCSSHCKCDKLQCKNNENCDSDNTDASRTRNSSDEDTSSSSSKQTRLCLATSNLNTPVKWSAKFFPDAV